MQYMGSKKRITKNIVPIIQKYIDDNGIINYLEPFVGGANVIDKIRCENKIGCDENEYLIELLKKIQQSTDEIPDYILKDTYDQVKNNKNNYPKWYQGLIGFCSFGNKMWGGYARNNKDDVTGERTKSYFKSIKSQAINLKNISFIHTKFQNIPKDKIKNAVIYCDPPYANTTKYKTDTFPYEEYYNWARELSKDNIVLCSEYNMPEDFECIWQKEITTTLSSGVNQNPNKQSIEKLFICRP